MIYREGDRLAVVQRDTYGFLDLNKIYTFKAYEDNGWILVKEHTSGAFYPERFKLAKEHLFDKLYLTLKS